MVLVLPATVEMKGLFTVLEEKGEAKGRLGSSGHVCLVVNVRVVSCNLANSSLYSLYSAGSSHTEMPDSELFQ